MKRIDQPVAGRYELRQPRPVSVQAELVELRATDDFGRIADRAPLLELRIAGEPPTTSRTRILDVWPYMVEVDDARWQLLARADADGLPDPKDAKLEHALKVAERLAELRDWLDSYAAIWGGLPKPTTHTITTGTRNGRAHVARRTR